jgi:hypothetical protein
VQRQLWHIANELGMIPLLGPEDGITGNYPAILVKAHAGIRIIDAGPPPHPSGSAPSWCEALIRIRSRFRAAGVRRPTVMHLTPAAEPTNGPTEAHEVR